jgi:hypothetical protein
MTTTLNATTSNGLVVTPDNSGNVLLQYNGQSAPAFYAYANTNQSIPNTTWTKVLFQSEEFDTNNNFASSRFTPTVAGYYQLNSQIQYTTIASARNMFVIYKNGAEYRHLQDMQVTSTIGLIGSSLVYANGSTDYFEIYVYTGSGPYTLDSSSSAITCFSGCLLRGA